MPVEFSRFFISSWHVQVGDLVLQLGVDRVQLLVQDCISSLAVFQFLVRALELLVRGLQLLVGGLQLFVEASSSRRCCAGCPS